MASEQGSAVQRTERAQESSVTVQAILFDMVSPPYEWSRPNLSHLGDVAAHVRNHICHLQRADAAAILFYYLLGTAL